MVEGQRPEEIAYDQYIKEHDVYESLQRLGPMPLQVARHILPEPFKRLLNRFGLQEIPEAAFPLCSGEVITSADSTVVGFQPGDGEGLCGVAISPGEEHDINSVRARIVRSESRTDGHVAYVPEGSYQIVLVAPQPWEDRDTNELVYYTAQAIVTARPKQGNLVTGALTAFGKTGDPIGWMILNEWLEPGVLRYACRHVPGIVFPEAEHGQRAKVLKLVSLREEREGEVPEDTISGSGLIAVRFRENRIDVSGRRARQKKISDLVAVYLRCSGQLAPEAAYTYRTSTLRGGAGLTVFLEDEIDPFAVERGGSSHPIGPTVLLTVTSSPDFRSDPITFSDVRLKEHRVASDNYPSLQALSRWGFSKARALIPETDKS